ncbi:MAG: RpiB/LacA/LacB family sugar-phosphate isomerase [Spirochaetaceae bacterium]|nr:RpiB/LacA/LacB family sugar-phosphate isomerase [Spirochaetaceae bacterium]
MAGKTRIAVACDPGGFVLKAPIMETLAKHTEIELIDYGMDDPEHPIMYYKQAEKVARAIQEDRADRGILLCGTGQGMAIVANKFKGVYAGVVVDVFSAKKAKITNNANVITFGGLVTSPVLAVEALEAWLNVGFTEGMDDRREIITENFRQVQRLEQELLR